MEWLQEHEWMPNEPKIDLGEDFLVNIYNRQRATGLSLFIQHKSTDNIGKFRLKESPCFSYPVDVPDLLHWRKSAVPVYLVVCDAKEKSQRYYLGLYENIFKEIEATNSNWFNQEGIQIRIPAENIFDESAFAKIRIELADYFQPIYLKKHDGIGFRLTLSFPETPEGKERRTAFNQFFDAGYPVTLGREYIKEFRLSDWHERLYGPVQADNLTFTPKKTQQILQYRFEMVPDDGSAPATQSIKFRIVRGGRREVVLSNKSSEAPIEFTMTITRDNGFVYTNLNFKMRHAGNTAFDTRDAICFLLATKRGGTAYLIEENSGKLLGTETLTASPLEDNSLLGDLRLINQLIFIQQKLKLIKPFCLKNRKLTLQDYQKCAEVYDILRTGKNMQTASLSFSIKVNAALRNSLEEPLMPNACLEIKQKGKVSCRLLGMNIELGECQSDIKLTTEQTLYFIEQLNLAWQKGRESTRLHFNEVTLHTSYAQWLPKEVQQMQ